MVERLMTGSSGCALRLRELVKLYGHVRAVDGINLEVRTGELFALLGPSGCGKTTVLRSIAGIVEPTSGEIELNGEAIGHKPMYQRDTALVFQNYALFPHLSVFDNIAFGLRMRKRPKAMIRSRVETALDLVRLPTAAKRFPHQLSGGQQQRIALARALVVEPALLLLDEPLSNLDARLRDEMRGEILRLQRTLGLTTVLVTHDIQEALSVADRLAVMREGRIEQIGSPAEIYGAPRSRFVAEFVGHCNLFDATVATIGSRSVTLQLAGGVNIAVAVSDDGWRSGDRVWVVLPPERIRIGIAANGLANRHEAVVEESNYFGSLSHYALRIGGIRLIAQVQNIATAPIRIGDHLTIGWQDEDGFARHDG
jgi:putative spermidine/putrescine transport system ATP-binding protein